MLWKKAPSPHKLENEIKAYIARRDYTPGSKEEVYMFQGEKEWKQWRKFGMDVLRIMAYKPGEIGRVRQILKTYPVLRDAVMEEIWNNFYQANGRHSALVKQIAQGVKGRYNWLAYNPITLETYFLFLQPGHLNDVVKVVAKELKRGPVLYPDYAFQKAAYELFGQGLEKIKKPEYFGIYFRLSTKLEGIYGMEERMKALKDVVNLVAQNSAQVKDGTITSLIRIFKDYPYTVQEIVGQHGLNILRTLLERGMVKNTKEWLGLLNEHMPKTEFIKQWSQLIPTNQQYIFLRLQELGLREVLLNEYEEGAMHALAIYYQVWEDEVKHGIRKK